MSFTITGASPRLGSSSSRSRGRAMSPRPIAHICCSPPDSVPGQLALALAQPREQREDALERVAASRAGPPCARRARGCRARSSSERAGGPPARGRCRARRSRPSRSPSSRAPSNSMRPARSGRSPLIARRVVVLPAPFEPISATGLAVAHLERDARDRRSGRRSRPRLRQAGAARTYSSPRYASIDLRIDSRSRPARPRRSARRSSARRSDARAPSPPACCARSAGSTTPDAWIAADQLDDRLDLGRVQPGHHLVEQEQRRLGRERARQLETLALGQGQRAGRHARAAPSPTRATTSRARASASGARGWRASAPDPHVLEDGHARERPRRSGTFAPGRARQIACGGEPDDRAAAEANVAGVRGEEAREEIEDRRLAGAVGADETEHLAPAPRSGRARRRPGARRSAWTARAPPSRTHRAPAPRVAPARAEDAGTRPRAGTAPRRSGARRTRSGARRAVPPARDRAGRSRPAA